MRALQYAMVVVLNGVLVLLLVAGVQRLVYLDPSGGRPVDGVASVPQATPNGDGSVGDHLGALTDQLRGVGR